jgi:hypothetical protein
MKGSNSFAIYYYNLSLDAAYRCCIQMKRFVARYIGRKGIKGLKIKFFESVNKCIGPIQRMSKLMMVADEMIKSIGMANDRIFF